MESNTTAFTSAEQVALAKLIHKDVLKKASKAVSVGIHDVDFLVRIFGTFKKGVDGTQTIPAKADAWGLLALALSKLNGVTVDALIREFEAFDPKNVEEIKEQAQAALDTIKKSTKTTCNGKVTSVKLTVEQVPVVDIEQDTSAANVA